MNAQTGLGYICLSHIFTKHGLIFSELAAIQALPFMKSLMDVFCMDYQYLSSAIRKSSYSMCEMAALRSDCVIAQSDLSLSISC